MCSYQNSSEAFYGSESVQWDSQFISEFYEIDNSHQINITEGDVQHYSLYQQDTVLFSNENSNQNNIKNDSSTLLSPIWEDQKIIQTENPVNMSTYFSTFNPVQPQSQLPHPVANKSAQIRQYQQNYTKALEKIHRGRISLVPTSSGNFKAVVKRKRKRTIFTTEQIETLESVFSRKPYVTREERQVLVNQLKLSDKSVKIWFQNRRLKGKRDDSDNETSQDSNISKLDYVESEIVERTNEFGYVTLDDRIMNDLVSVIDDYLSRSPMEVDNSPIYEPISPASTIDDNSFEGNVSSYEETVQQLIDIESIISV